MCILKMQYSFLKWGIHMKRLKKKLLIKRTKAGAIIFVAFLIVYIPSFLHWNNTNNVVTGLTWMGKIEETINLNAYLIRNEEVLNSPFDGKLISNFNEGDRVSNGARIATIIKTDAENLLSELNEIDLKILQAQKERNISKDLFRGDLDKLEKDIKHNINRLINLSNANNLSSLGNIKNDIDLLMDRKASIMLSVSTNDVYLRTLMEQKNNLQRNIDLKTQNIISDSTGLVSFYLDGYEQTLNSSSIKNLTPNELSKIENNMVFKDLREVNVELEKPFAKIIKDFEYYIVAVMDIADAHRFNPGQRIKMRINNIHTEIDGVVEYKSERMGGEHIVAIKANKALRDTAGLRIINMDIILNSSSGIKVPLKALRDINNRENTAYLARIRANVVRFQQVKIVGKNEEFAIIDNMEFSFSNNVGLYDTYIINHEKFEEGQLIN